MAKRKMKVGATKERRADPAEKPGASGVVTEFEYQLPDGTWKLVPVGRDVPSDIPAKSLAYARKMGWISYGGLIPPAELPTTLTLDAPMVVEEMEALDDPA